MEKYSSSWDEISGEEEPLSPMARMFNEPRYNMYVVANIGLKTRIDTSAFKTGLQDTFLHHPRFFSKMVVDDDNYSNMRWVPTIANIENHVIVPSLDPNDIVSPDKFLEDYISNLTRIPLDNSKPLWEVHLLNVKTSEAEAVALFKIHHSIGDGASLNSLLLACCRKCSDPDSLPTIPVQKRARSSKPSRFWFIFWMTWSFFRMIFNTLMDIILFIATCSLLKDSDSPIKGGPGVNLTPKRFVHRRVSLEDIKLVKDAMNMTVNDVLLGVTEMTLSQYLNRRYSLASWKRVGEMKESYLPKILRIRSVVAMNMRPTVGLQALAEMMSKKSKSKWGNQLGYILIPFHIALRKDPLDYVRNAKATIDRKKFSLQPMFSFGSAKLLLKLIGLKAAVDLTEKVFYNTTMSYSSLVGPIDEVSLFGHPLAYHAPSVYGHPQALTIHYQSYVNQMNICIAVDPEIIPDPHQLCYDLEDSLEVIKSAVLKSGFKKA